MKNKHHAVFVTFVLFAGLNLAAARNVALAWNASSTPNPAGYNIHYGMTSGSYTNKLSVGNVTTATISNLTAGVTYFFVATTVDTNGNESAFSNEAAWTVPVTLTMCPGVKPGDPVSIQFPVASGHWYEVQATTDLHSWTNIWQTGVATSNACVQFTDTSATAFSSRFYRLALH
jgi:hypothetical protein